MARPGAGEPREGPGGEEAAAGWGGGDRPQRGGSAVRWRRGAGGPRGVKEGPGRGWPRGRHIACHISRHISWHIACHIACHRVCHIVCHPRASGVSNVGCPVGPHGLCPPGAVAWGTAGLGKQRDGPGVAWLVVGRLGTARALRGETTGLWLESAVRGQDRVSRSPPVWACSWDRDSPSHKLQPCSTCL